MTRNPNPSTETPSSHGSPSYQGMPSLADATPARPVAGRPVVGQSVKGDHVGSDESIGAQRFEITDIAGGCLASTLSAALSCVFLVINGAFVMALLSVAASGGAQWIENEKLSQFLLFGLPIALLIVQWRLIDTLRWILRRRQR